MSMPRTSPIPRAEQDHSLLSADEKRELVQRVVNSDIFRRSSALCAFLLYITNQEILGQAEKLKEQTIGVEVLGRRPDYVPTNDNIVRVRAHDLRGRLERYFAFEGSNEPVVINIPVGGYCPEYVPRKAGADEMLTISPASATVPEASDQGQRSKRHWFPLAAVILLTLASVFALVRSYTLRGDGSAAAARPGGAIRDFWGQFFVQPHEELKVVYADPSFALWQDLHGKTLNLGDYLNRRYLASTDDKLFNETARRVTSPADIAAAVHIATLAGEFGGQINLQFARDASADFFQRGNVVLIGSHRSNPWVEIYEPSLNFVLEQDPHSGAPSFRNRSPQAHEAQVYAIPTTYDRPGVEEREYTSYGMAALLKGCGNRGLTVLAEGLNMQATLAVGDMITDPQMLSNLLKSIGHRPGTNAAPFEALIQVTSLPHEYDKPKVIAFRIRPAQSCVGD